MKCSFTIVHRGLEYHFDNELLLNDFIRDRYSMYNELGDIVFSKKNSTESLNTFKRILDVRKTAEELKAAKFQDIVSDDSDNKLYDTPYVGVNLYISEYTFEENGLTHNLVPIFKSDNYWDLRYKSWSKTGDETRFTPEEIDTFFGGDKDLAKQAVVTEKSTQANYRQQIERRWAYQCVQGDAFHAAMRELFYVKAGSKLPRLIDTVSTKGRQAVAEEILKKIGGKTFKKNNILTKTFAEVCTLDRVMEFVDYAQKLIGNIRGKYGADCFMMPEITISASIANVKTANDPNKILGTIDLLVIDEQGKVHILDYKVSAKHYSETSTAKSRTYMYQMQMYRNILEANGIRMDASSCEVVPVLMYNFHKNQNTDDYEYDKLETLTGNLTHDLDSDIIKYNVNVRIKDVLIKPPSIDDVEATKVLETVSEYMKAYFAGYNRTTGFTEEEVVLMIKDVNGFTPTESNMLVYVPEGQTSLFSGPEPVDISNFKTKAEAEAQLVENVMTYVNKAFTKRDLQMSNIYKCIQLSLNKNDIDEGNWPILRVNDNLLASDWLKMQFAEYIYPSWELLNSQKAQDIFRDFGCVALKNIETGQIDIVKISTKPLRNQYNFLRHGIENTGIKRNLITGALKGDLFYESQTDNQLLTCEYGNIELIETMLMLNECASLFEHNALGKVLVLNPFNGATITASNLQLRESFKALDEACETKLKVNNFRNGKIKMFDPTMFAKLRFLDIMSSANSSEHPRPLDKKIADVIGGFKLFWNEMSFDTSAEEKLLKLEELRKQLEDPHYFGDILKNVSSHDLKTTKASLLLLYNQVLIAIADCRGIHLKQLLRDHAKYIESAYIWRDGLSGSQTDNPGLLKSESLNLLTKLCTEAYQNARDDMAPIAAKILNLVKELKKEKSFGYILSRTIGNQANLYTNMYVTDPKISLGDFMFKSVNDATLTNAEQNFLKEALKIINRNRFRLKYNTEEELEHALDEMEQNYDKAYYRVPLAAGDAASTIAATGMFTAFKEFLNSWNPKEITKRFKDKTMGIFRDSSESYAHDEKLSSLFELDNQFAIGDENISRRLNNIASHRKVDANGNIIRDGTYYYEHNLETLLLKHSFVYAKNKLLNMVMPVIKAIMVHLVTLGNNQNIKFSNDVDYVEKYVRNKIKNEPIFGKNLEKVGIYINKLKSISSFMALAFNPVIGIYLFIQAMWNDISLIIRKPDGSNAFTFANFAKAYKIVFADMVKTTNDRPSVISRMNELYGNNDMDMNTYIDRIKTDKHGIFNFKTIAYKFAQRPDYYNRMAIFVAQSLENGSFYAHSLKDGKLVYDFKKDGRFSAFISGDKSNIELYNNQRALYMAMAKLFAREHAKNPDGTDFVFDPSGKTPLPRAYTNLEAESMKAMSDEIYGYYSHEKKSLIQSTLWGCMWLLFRTYWSGKKNQYLQHGGVKLEGHWALSTFQNGQKAYYQVDLNGKPMYDMEPTATDTGFPVMQWQGDWKEGIVLTIAKGFSTKGGFHDLWYNTDPQLRRCYRSNIQKLFYDLVVFAVIGRLLAAGMAGWFDEEKDELDLDDPTDALKLSIANIGIRSISNSFLDFNFILSIGEPLADWQPFSLSWITRNGGHIYNAVFGDADFAKTAIKMTGFGNQTKYFWNSLLPDDDK